MTKNKRMTITPRPLTERQQKVALLVYGRTFSDTNEVLQAAFDRLDEFLTTRTK